LERLRYALSARRTTRSRFTLRRTSLKGRGIAPEFTGEAWSAVRDAIYRGRGT